jgi:hypothetical protein
VGVLNVGIIFRDKAIEDQRDIVDNHGTLGIIIAEVCVQRDEQPAQIVRRAFVVHGTRPLFRNDGKSESVSRRGGAVVSARAGLDLITGGRRAGLTARMISVAARSSARWWW